MNTTSIPHGQPSTRAAQSLPTGPIRRILVVDDDSTIRQLNSVVLEHSGYEVDTAADGVDAWRALNTDCYDLLLTDHNMPRMTGVELIKKLRATLNAIPVILISGMPPREELRQHPWLHIEAVLGKPYRCGELLATVEEVLHANDEHPGAHSRRLRSDDANQLAKDGSAYKAYKGGRPLGQFRLISGNTLASADLPIALPRPLPGT